MELVHDGDRLAEHSGRFSHVQYCRHFFFSTLVIDHGLILVSLSHSEILFNNDVHNVSEPVGSSDC